jgi:hypothetical protein
MFPPCLLSQTFIYTNKINEHVTFKAKIESLKFMLKNMNWDIGIQEQFENLKVKTNHHRNKTL